MTHVDDQKQQILTWMVNEIKHLLTNGVVEEQGDNTVTQHPIQVYTVLDAVWTGNDQRRCISARNIVKFGRVMVFMPWLCILLPRHLILTVRE